MKLRYLTTVSTRFRGHRIAHAIRALLLALFFVSSAAAGEMLSICHGSPASALVPLAKMQGFFAAEGLEIEARTLPSGFQSMQAMFRGECALATAAAPPVSYQSLRRKDFRILAAISTNGDDDHIIVRRDRGIQNAADLRGRRVAVPEGTSAHYFLDTYLAAHGISPGEVSKRYLPPQDISGAFRRGEADVAVLWEPHILKLSQEFGGKAKVLTAPGLVVSPFLLLVRKDYLQTHPSSVQAVLRALSNAERFAHEQPGKAQAMLATHYGLSAQDVAQVWPQHDFHVSLNQPLLFILESVARWQIRQMPPAHQPQLPNFLDVIYPDALKAVKPGAVSIIE